MFGSPTDVPEWEKNSAGFNTCAFAMHGIQIVGKQTLKSEFNVF